MPNVQCLTFDGLWAFGREVGYRKGLITAAWTTIAANLPTGNNSVFHVYDEAGKRIKLITYRKEYRENGSFKWYQPHRPRIEQQWKIGRELIEAFQVHAKLNTVYQWGSTSQRLLDAWLASLDE